MSKHSPIRATRAIVAAAGSPAAAPETPEFAPATPKERADGWSAQRQLDFIAALTESGCVTEACQTVGASTRGAYRLRARADAVSFRAAWDAALEIGLRRLADATLSRAINGVRRPVFYQGEQIGERVYYDERLAMFLLRTRDAMHHGAWRDRREPRREPDAEAVTLARWIDNLREDAAAQEAGQQVEREPEPDATEWLNDQAACNSGLRDSRGAITKPWPTPEETNAEIMRRIKALREHKAASETEANYVGDEDEAEDDDIWDDAVGNAAAPPAAARAPAPPQGPGIRRLDGGV
jgi:hypothetical protein